VADATRVVLINATLARRHWGESDPIGQRVQFWGQSHEIVGVVSDVHHFGLDEAPAPELYLPHAQNPAGDMFLTVRTSGDPARLAATIRREIAVLDPAAAIGEVRTMNRVRAEFTAPERLMAGLLGAFALVALVIAAIGVYGVMAYAVSQRTHEIGIRLALGAQLGDVLRLIVGQGMALAGVGLAIGLAAAFGVTRLLRSVLYGVGPADPATFAGVVLLLALSAFTAVYVPARRAARLNPLVALRAQ
jgi:putative ABC transport system permease protein